jgi:LysM repeat protein
VGRQHPGRRQPVHAPLAASPPLQRWRRFRRVNLTLGRGLLLSIGLSLAAAVLVLASLLSAGTEGVIAGVTPRAASPQPNSCQPPAGWAARPLAAGESLAELAASYGLPLGELLAANCLTETTPDPGQLLFLPASTPTPAAACGPPAGWVLTIPGPSDDLGQLAASFGVSEQDLRQANCLEPGTPLHAGQRLYLPATPTASVAPATPPIELATPSATT